MTSSCHLPFVLPRLPQFQLASLAHVTFPFSYLVSDKLPYYLLKPALSVKRGYFLHLGWGYSHPSKALGNHPLSNEAIFPTAFFSQLYRLSH